MKKAHAVFVFLCVTLGARALPLHIDAAVARERFVWFAESADAPVILGVERGIICDIATELWKGRTKQAAGLTRGVHTTPGVIRTFSKREFISVAAPAEEGALPVEFVAHHGACWMLAYARENTTSSQETAALEIALDVAIANEYAPVDGSTSRAYRACCSTLATGAFLIGLFYASHL